jgi:proteic killer suppression protein
MEIRYATRKLARLATEEGYAAKFDRAIVRGYRKVLGAIEAAKDERDLYANKGLGFEKLSGDRRGQRSLRINEQWRVIVTIDKTTGGKEVVVVEIVDYH